MEFLFDLVEKNSHFGLCSDIDVGIFFFLFVFFSFFFCANGSQTERQTSENIEKYIERKEDEDTHTTKFAQTAPISIKNINARKHSIFFDVHIFTFGFDVLIGSILSKYSLNWFNAHTFNNEIGAFWNQKTHFHSKTTFDHIYGRKVETPQIPKCLNDFNYGFRFARVRLRVLLFL